MNAPAPHIFIGDYIRAVRALYPAGGENPATCAAIARLLGFELGLDAGAAVSPSPTPTPEPARQRTRPSPVPWHKPARPAGEVAPRAEPRWIPSVIESVPAPSPGADAADVLAGVPPLGSSASGDWEGSPVKPLLVERWTRAILFTLASTPAEGDVDLDQLVEQLGQAVPITRLPRLPLPSLRGGLHVLVDVGPGMTPFASDVRWLLARLRDVVGGERLQVQVFSGHPQRGPLRDGFGQETGPWRPPPAGTPVLLVSDLGAARARFPLESASPPEWVAFARATRRAGCPLMALSPWAARRYDGVLRRALTLVPWDQRTTAGKLRRQLARSRTSTDSSHGRD